MDNSKKTLEVLAIFFAIAACIAGWLALPQVQRLLEQLNPPNKIVASPTLTPIFELQPTYTPLPTYTAYPTMLPVIPSPTEAAPATSAPISASAPTEAVQPTDVLIPTLIPSPIPTISLDTPSGSILNKGQYWRQNDLSLILEDVAFDTGRSCASFDFDLNNDSSHDVILTIVLSQFSVTDNTGRTWTPRALSHYVFCGDPGPWNDSQISTSVAPGQSYWDAAYTTWIVSFDGPLTDPQVTNLYITVNGLAQFSNATWGIAIK
jgi:hypothetical protein